MLETQADKMATQRQMDASIAANQMREAESRIKNEADRNKQLMKAVQDALTANARLTEDMAAVSPRHHALSRTWPR